MLKGLYFLLVVTIFAIVGGGLAMFIAIFVPKIAVVIMTIGTIVGGIAGLVIGVKDLKRLMAR